MSIQGIKNNQQLESLKTRIQNIQNTPEDIFREFGISDSKTERRKFKFFCDDILLQLYKFNNASPGEVVKITSMITSSSWNFEAYATRDKDGNFEIVLRNRQSGNAKKMLSSSLESWTPQTSLATQLDHFSQKFKQNPPVHLMSYVGKGYNLYVDAIKDAMPSLHSNTSIGQSITIPSDKNKGRNHPLHVVKTSATEFQVLLETGNPNEPFVQLNKDKKVIWKQHKGVFLDEQAMAYLARTQKAREAVKNKGVPQALNGLINKEDLLKMYDYILNDPNTIARLSAGKEFRLDKKATGNARTMNIVRDLNGEFMLMLETKSKLASGKKSTSSVIGKGTFGTVKPVWRIDSAEPEEWANKAMRGENVVDADYEAVFSQRIVESLPSGSSAQSLNTTLLGELFTSRENVKRSQYSKRAIGDLEAILKNPNRFPLTNADRERIKKDILEGIAIMHAQGKVHQDLKLKNIFIYRDANGGFYAKVADFGIGYDPNSPKNQSCLASAGYESPEILLAHLAQNAPQHNYYHNDSWIKNNSYAYQKFAEEVAPDPDSQQAIDYRKPHPANDMWALGVIFYKLESGADVNLSDEGISKASPLVQGLLKTSREERINIAEAQAQENQKKGEARRPSSLSEEDALQKIAQVLGKVLNDGAQAVTRHPGSETNPGKQVRVEYNFLQGMAQDENIKAVKQTLIQLGLLDSNYNESHHGVSPFLVIKSPADRAFLNDPNFEVQLRKIYREQKNQLELESISNFLKNAINDGQQGVTMHGGSPSVPGRQVRIEYNFPPHSTNGTYNAMHFDAIKKALTQIGVEFQEASHGNSPFIVIQPTAGNRFLNDSSLYIKFLEAYQAQLFTPAVFRQLEKIQADTIYITAQDKNIAKRLEAETRLNDGIERIIELAQNGDASQGIQSNSEWLKQNQPLIDTWLKSDVVKHSIKQQLQKLTRPEQFYDRAYKASDPLLDTIMQKLLEQEKVVLASIKSMNPGGYNISLDIDNLLKKLKELDGKTRAEIVKALPALLEGAQSTNATSALNQIINKVKNDPEVVALSSPQAITLAQIARHLELVNGDINYLERGMHDPRRTQNSTNTLNNGINAIITFTQAGDQERGLPPYPKWLSENKQVIASWLENGFVTHETRQRLQLLVKPEAYYQRNYAPRDPLIQRVWQEVLKNEATNTKYPGSYAVSTNVDSLLRKLEGIDRKPLATNQKAQEVDALLQEYKSNEKELYNMAPIEEIVNPILRDKGYLDLLTKQKQIAAAAPVQKLGPMFAQVIAAVPPALPPRKSAEAPPVPPPRKIAAAPPIQKLGPLFAQVIAAPALPPRKSATPPQAGAVPVPPPQKAAPPQAGAVLPVPPPRKSAVPPQVAGLPPAQPLRAPVPPPRADVKASPASASGSQRPVGKNFTPRENALAEDSSEKFKAELEARLKKQVNKGDRRENPPRQKPNS